MMFHGTYRSEFYRAVRELLHDQVSAQELHTMHRHDDYDEAEQALRRRWELLVARESHYRRDVDSSLDPGTALAV
jgi:anaerobic magnesium-protoporphyrin IX monomethyl ester cyclase